MKLYFSIYLIALAGCATTPDKPPELLTRVETITIREPVPIPCVDADEKPPIPPTNMRAGTDAEVSLGKLRADLDDWKTYGIKADAILTSCQNAAKKPPKGP